MDNPKNKLTVNQHYVWQHYLQAWSINNKIWCKRIGNQEPFHTPPRNIASERFFYEVYELSPGDVAYLKAVISRSNNDKIRKLNLEWIETFQASFALRKRLNGAEVNPKFRMETEIKLRNAEKMMGELFHGKVENEAIPILNALRQRDISFYADENSSINFITYISHQYFRTAKLRNAMLAIPNPLSHDMSRTWPIEAIIYATNLAASLVLQRQEYRIVLLRNTSQLPFITGDQPIINLRGVDVDEVDLYYPLQPDLAMIFTSDQIHYPSNDADIGSVLVERYNHRIYAKSDTQIYGNDPNYLSSLANLPKDEQF